MSVSFPLPQIFHIDTAGGKENACGRI